MEIYKEIILAIIAFALLCALIGLYITLRVWSIWRHTDINLIRAKVFLKKDFLNKNFIFVFLVGALVSLHVIFEFMEFYGTIPSVVLPFWDLVYIIEISTVLILLVILAYEWFKIIK
ncbi:MAG: hypothetical protein ACE5KT_04470 [Methanosarcinales archaeon]